MPCPSEKALAQFADFTLPDSETADVRAHVAVCPRCEEAVEWIRVHVLPRRRRTELDGYLEDEDEVEVEVEVEEDNEITKILSRIDGRSPSPTPRQPVFDPTILDPSSFPGALGRVGRYEVLATLGNGGFGTVIRGWDSVERHPVAIKMLSGDRLADPDSIQRFHREIRFSSVTHPHVVSILAVDEHRGSPILVMEYMAGGSLRDRLHRSPPIPPIKMLRYGTHIAEGLAAIHAVGMIHCDIKPSNILLDAPTGGNAKISDFGLACFINEQTESRPANHFSHELVIGTPAYMSPEQLGHRPIDVQSDLFSLGSLLYAMVAGESPFQGRFPYDSIQKVVESQPQNLLSINPEISPVLADVVERLLRKNCAERIQSAREVAYLLNDELRRLT